MARILVCFLLISLNVFYAFENHSGESDVKYETSTNITAQFHANAPCADHDEHTQGPIADHPCHLGHCGFTVSSYVLSFKVLQITQNFPDNKKAPSPFIDEDVRPPIFS